MIKAGKNNSFLGIDGCKNGWVGVSLNAAMHYAGKIYLWQSSADLINALHKWEIALIDMPIGLVDRAPGIRRCEPAAREMLGTKRSSIFSPSVRQALDAPTYEEACRINTEICGKKISRQAWNILPKIRSLDVILREQPSLQSKIRESHPELCFCVLNGGKPLPSKKKATGGVGERLNLLKRHSRLVA